MLTQNLLHVAYLAAGVLFILSLGGLATQETARRGNGFGIFGMVLAIVATLFAEDVGLSVLVALPLVAGGAIGAVLAKRVVMTAMPELVAMLHSFVGLAAVFVGLSTYLAPGDLAESSSHLVHAIEIWVDVAIGAITFTGSVVAWGKLSEKISGRPLLLPGRHWLNLGIVTAIVLLAIPFVNADTGLGFALLLIMSFLAFGLGAHLVMAIGGADMPVVVSLLNSYSGWAAAAAGFMLSNDLLIMCRAMNRSIWNVVFGGFGTESSQGGPVDTRGKDDVTAVSAQDAADILKDAKSVVIVPGYGMAVARAQHPVMELTRILRNRGCTVRHAIHPVAGRLPGHMNVLLAEAGVPYDIVLEMEEINHDFPDTDAVLVIGANDIVNPGAEDDPSSPIYGMPVLQAWKAGTVIVMKRSMGTGYAGVQNPLFFLDNSRMLFGDAKDQVEAMVAALKTG